MDSLSSFAARSTDDLANRGTTMGQHNRPNVKWLITLSIHESGKLSDSWSDMALVISTLDSDAREHLSRYRYKGDAIAIDLHAICSDCRSWHTFRLTQVTFFQISRVAKFERNLCENCFDRLSPHRGRKGRLGADLTVAVDFQLDPHLRRGTIDVVGTKVPTLGGTNRERMSVNYTLDWPVSTAAPVLELIFVCPICFAEQIAASSEILSAPPSEWTCAACRAEHQRDWAWQMTTAFIKECRCYFCDRLILTHEAAVHNEGQFDTRGFSRCQECQRFARWNREWGSLSVALNSRNASFPLWALALLVNLIVGECQAQKPPHMPSATRLRYWRMIPMGRLPLTLDEGSDTDDLGY